MRITSCCHEISHLAGFLDRNDRHRQPTKDKPCRPDRPDVRQKSGHLPPRCELVQTLTGRRCANLQPRGSRRHRSIDMLASDGSVLWLHLAAAMDAPSFSRATASESTEANPAQPTDGAASLEDPAGAASRGPPIAEPDQVEADHLIFGSRHHGPLRVQRTSDIPC